MITILSALVASLPQVRLDMPPSTAFVPGGRTRIGIDLKEVERMVENDPNAPNFAGALIAETPHQDLFVDSFWMMLTEVTQDQYGAFVRATGALPLESWCESAIKAAALDYARDAEHPAIDDNGKQGTAPKKGAFDRRAWWIENGRRVAWSIPNDDRLLPVVFVDYAAARAYSRWAGMRLPTEFEFQRAVRGDSNQNFPWGNDWDNDKFAATSHLKKRGGAWPVGSFPAGRSKQGICDLAGNVWEWTSSPYTSYPGYQQRVFELGYGAQRRPINAIADWNAEQRVVVGGSFQALSLMCRASVRRGTVRAQNAGALGFRCAASVRPGVDMAHYVLDDDFDVQLRPRIDNAVMEYAPELALCVDGWRSTLVPAAEGSASPPDRYARVEDYRYVLFVPTAQIPAVDPSSFDKRSLEEPIPLGILSANVPLLEPPLDAGTYLVSYRAHGVRRLGDSRASAPTHFGEVPVEEALKLDVNFDHVIVTDLRGTPITALRRRVEYGPEREGRMDSFEPEIPPEGARPSKRVQLEACLPCRTTKKGFLLSLPLRFEVPDPNVVWRR